MSRVPAAVRGERLVRVAMVVRVGIVAAGLRDGHGQPPAIAGSRRTSSAGGDRRVEPCEVADVLAVDVDVDEPVEVAVVGQQLLLERRMLLDERVDDRRGSSRRRARAT